MSFVRVVLPLSLLAALLLVACGGGGSGGRPDLRRIPTATPFDTLPPATIVSGEGVLGGASSSGNTYVVESGDSLSAIAIKLGVSLDDLISLNDLADPSRLEVGQVLKVPAAPGSTAGATPQPQATPRTGSAPAPTGDMETYVVESGDNASDIAARFGVTLQELADANSTTIDGLRDLEVGQELNIPPPSQEPQPEPTEEPVQEVPTEEPTVEPTPEQSTEAPSPEQPGDTTEATSTPEVPLEQ